MATKQYKVNYEVTVSREEESKNVTIRGERVYEAGSAEQAEERANEEWENGLESSFIDGKHLLDDDIFDVSLDILEVTPAIVEKEKNL
jgi:hypothetical protein